VVKVRDLFGDTTPDLLDNDSALEIHHESANPRILRSWEGRWIIHQADTT